MKLDKRLSVIGNFVPVGARLADIGTDHAYLPAALLQTGQIAYAVAADIAADPCKVALNTLQMYGVSGGSEVRQGSGLSVLQVGECDCIVVAGMGGATIVDILKADLQVARSAKRLILQPMVGAAAVRKFLLEQGFALVAEDLVEDGKFLYEIMVAEYQGQVQTLPEAVLLIGPVLLKQRHPLLTWQFVRQKGILQRTLKEMQKSSVAVAGVKYQELQNLLYEMEKLEKNL